MAAIAQLLRFTLPRSSPRVPAFHALRECVSSKALVKTQYFGYVFPNEGFPVPKPDDEMCWLIRTPSPLFVSISFVPIIYHIY
jgi:2-succinyl-5-enolpyruvyl-6-hydroxy-3-cyclohexene-1-carboxylate synthase